MDTPVPKGPLAVRWRRWSLDGRKAGSLATARVAVENAGTATWHTRDETNGNSDLAGESGATGVLPHAPWDVLAELRLHEHCGP